MTTGLTVGAAVGRAFAGTDGCAVAVAVAVAAGVGAGVAVAAALVPPAAVLGEGERAKLGELVVC